jgi:post-segregation antitoxin (ccd killing protein)
MGTKQITVKVDQDVLEQARQYANGNMSAYAAAAIREQVLRDAAEQYRRYLETHLEVARHIEEATARGLEVGEKIRREARRREGAPG